MAKLPEHSWIRISKAFQIVMDTSEANYFDVEASLVSAFRDEAIRTRARSKRYFKHETQTQIGGIAGTARAWLGMRIGFCRLCTANNCPTRAKWTWMTC